MNNNKIDIFLSIISLGCNKNQVDSEVLLSNLSEDFTITGDLKQAEVIVVSPCSFLKSARKEALDLINDLIEYKKQYNCKCIVLIGCGAEAYKLGLLKVPDAVDLIVDISCIKNLKEFVINFFDKKTLSKRNYFKNLKSKKLLTSKKRIVPTKSSAYVKISDGCDNLCSYCLIPSIRGQLLSRSEQDIICEVKRLINLGIKEINLLGQDIGNYGVDLYGKSKLVDLIKKILKLKGLKWLRLLYLHPIHLDKEILNIMNQDERLCKYLDIPLQHVSDNVLDEMGRKISNKDIIKLLNIIRNRVPDIVLRTTFIVGFPKETKKDFNKLVSFIKKYPFEKLGVFKYSREKGTPSYNLKKQVNWKEKNRRQREVLSTQKLLSYRFNKKMIGNNYEVLVEELLDQENNYYKGRTSFMAPEVDGSIYFSSNEKLKQGSFVNVKVLDCDHYDLFGEEL